MKNKKTVFASSAKQSSDLRISQNQSSLTPLILTLFFLVLFFLNTFAYATVSLVLESEKINIGQSFKIIVTEENVKQFNIPDLAPLQKDFAILGTEQSTNYSLINGQSTSTNQWTIILMPKRAGKLEIPSLSFGQEKTNAKSIEVQKADNQNQASPKTKASDKTTDSEPKFKEIILAAEVSNKKPYINEEVMYTVRLYKHQNLLDAVYQAPTVTDALLIPLGQGRRYQASKEGQIYAVEELVYAIFPQKSGKITITAPTLNALIYRNLPEQIRVSAPTVNLQVQPAPLALEQNWLPAQDIRLTESFDKKPPKLPEGSTIVRTITLEAKGLPAQLLPAFTISKSKDFSVYQEKAGEKNNLKDNALVGTKTIKITYLFNKAGKIQVPAETLSWFNTNTKQEAKASLPAFNIEIEANAANTTPLARTTPPTTAALAPVASTQKSVKTSNNNYLPWAIAALFALLWLLTLLLKKTPSLKPAFFMNMKKKKQINTHKELEQACRNQEPNKAKKALVDWAQETWPEDTMLDLSDIQSKIDDENMKKEIQKLIETLYHATSASASRTWRGDALWQSFCAYTKNKKLRKKEKLKSQEKTLPPLNPQ